MGGADNIYGQSFGSVFDKNPMLKFVFPLMAGIAFSWHCNADLFWGIPLFFLGLFAMLLGMHSRFSRWLFGVALAVTMFSFGMLAECDDRATMHSQWSGEKGRFEAVLLEVPHMGGATTKIKAMVKRIGRDSIPNARREGVVDIYIANCVAAEYLQIGERIYFEAKVAAPRNAGNPGEFDLEHYSYLKGVTGNVYLPVDGWRSLGFSELTLQMKALELREKIVTVFESLGFGKEELSVLSALTVGEKRDLSKGVRELYNAAGVSHLLALSGLHLGLFYMIITFLLPLPGGRRGFVIVREAVVVILLWGFALMAGMSPSVVRAAILFTIMSLSRCLQRENSSMNSLAFAALIMLLVYPRWLFDVGFQLSFVAVAAILLLQRPMQRIAKVEEYGCVYRYVVGVMIISVAAQIGTFPFVWHYFGTFPLYFLFTNLVVIPLSFVIMLFSVLLLAVTPFALIQIGIAVLLNFLIACMNNFLRLAASLPAASLELPFVGVWGVATCAVAFYLLLYACFLKRKPLLWLSFSLFAIMGIVFILFRGKEEKPYIIFYNSSECPAAQFVYSKDKSYLLSSYPEWEIELEYTAEPYWRREEIDEPLLLLKGYSDDKISFDGRMACFEHRRVIMLNDDCWNDADKIVPVDCLFLCRGFLGDIKELLLLFPARYIVLDATLYTNSRRRIKRECAELGVRCIDVAEQGAVKMLCNKTGVRFVNMRGL